MPAELLDATARIATLLRQGRNQQALDLALDAIRRHPVEAWSWRLAGQVQSRIGAFSAAEVALRQSLECEPRDAMTWVELARVLRALRRHGDAVGAARRAWELEPSLGVRTELGNALAAAGAPEEAVGHLQSVVDHAPDAAAHWANLGNVLRQLGRTAESLAALDRALALEPGHPSLSWNRAMALLAAERWQEGFAVAEHRHRRAPGGAPDGWDRQYQGQLLDGEEVRLYCEQGFGDALMFARFAQAVAARGGTPVIEAHPKLQRLLGTARGVARVIPKGSEPRPRHFAWLMDLPHLLQISPNTYAHGVPYLHAEPARVDRVREAMGPGFKVAVAWQGNPLYEADHLRSPGLHAFAPLSALSGVRFIGLQKHVGMEQLEGSPLRVEDWGSRLDNDGHAFLDTAAALRCVELLITSDSAIAHLAGAMGVPVWLVLPFSADWRWGVSGYTSPFYPSMRLFRQPRPHDWESVFRDVAVALVGAQLNRRRHQG